MRDDDDMTPEDEASDQSGGNGRPPWATPEEPDLGSWIEIAADGAVVVYTGKVEVGQNIRTSLSQQVAEELRVPVDFVRLIMGDTDLTPFDMGTFGSMTTPIMGLQLRNAAATARELLIRLAAEHWQVNPDGLTAENGRVVDGAAGRSISYSELTQGRRLDQKVADDALTTPPDRWVTAGKPIAKVGGENMVTGRHRYTGDLRLPGMLHGKVLRAPAFGARPASVDAGPLQKMAGAQLVHEDNFIGVAASDAPTARRALSAIKVQWSAASPMPPQEQLYHYLKTHPGEPQGYHRFIPTRFDKGSVADGMAAAQRSHTGSYNVAYIAHAPLEPRAAVAMWQDGKLTVWTGTQRPFGVRAELAEAFGIPERRVQVIVPDTGSGYGGKHTGEAAIEAARLAKATGKPVQVKWSREEEFTWAYFRNAGVIDITSGVLTDGKITAWEHHTYNSGPEAMRPPYDFPNELCQFHFADSPLRQGSYRALAATANMFARETHMDELAVMLGVDPLQLRLKNLRDSRLVAVLQAAAGTFRWEQYKAGPNHGIGIAGGFEKGSYVATCAEVAVDPSARTARIVRVVEAFECGAIVNPEGLRNQVEGAIVQATGGALFEQITFGNGTITNPRFSEYRLPRFSDLPVIETILIDRTDIASAGAGETPITGLAPAVGNAIFNATGVRLRSLPLAPGAIPSAGS